ncbi:MAG TPA: RNA polymerase factor sigma-54, partial [Chitinophagaceae bacterium]|nr:RNA polymerase factor sigma-54 [Chitinophagaceae bacterium]
MKLLQVPTANLEERIKEELEENPALEQSEDVHEEDTDLADEFTGDEEGDAEDPELDGSADEYENLDISEYVSDEDDDIAEYKLKDDNYPELDEGRTIQNKIETSFHDYLLEQLGMLKMGEDQRRIAEQIVGSIDDDGYLRRETNSIVDDLAFRQNISTTAKEVEMLIRQIQQFDPPGIAARDLQECLLLQLYRKQIHINEEAIDQAINILEHYFEEFTKKHYDKIQRGLNLTDEDLKGAINQIIKLSPKPGGNIGENSVDSYIIPDFFVYNNAGQLELTLNTKNAPDLRVSEGYRDMLREYDRGSKKDKRQKEAVIFIKQKIDAAKWFIDAIKQRQHTLYITMEAIMMHQEEFFFTGDETSMRPMILKDIAEKTGLDISTVSRVANSKFVQTEFGTYRLKFFFSESLSTESGEEVSTREVKKILSDMVEAESKRKPLSDERLTEMLIEKG